MTVIDVLRSISGDVDYKGGASGRTFSGNTFAIMLTLEQAGATREAMRRRSAWAGAASLCVVLAVLHTWPLATAPGTLSRNDNNDAQLNEWIMAWVAHQLPRAPTHLFDANIFFPARHTLAFSEPLIVPALLGAPVAWAGGSPVLVTT